MSTAVSMDIKTILSEMTELEFATNLFIGREPDSPDNCVTIFDLSGTTDITLSEPKAYSRDSFQVRVRNTSYPAAAELCWKIKEKLHKFTGTVNGTYYVLITVTVNPNHLDWDDSDRARFVVTFTAQREVEL